MSLKGKQFYSAMGQVLVLIRLWFEQAQSSPLIFLREQAGAM
jgi:hypothetical protein